MKFIKTGGLSRQTDEELTLLYFNGGDQEVVAILFDRYVHLVFGVCMKYLKDEDEAKDASLEVFEGILESLKKYKVTFFKSWLHRVARNHCLAKLKASSGTLVNLKELQKDELEFVESRANASQEKIERELAYSGLESAIAKLNPDQKMCIELFYLQEKSYKEISETCNLSLLQVKSHIQNGKRNLKIFLTQSHGLES